MGLVELFNFWKGKDPEFVNGKDQQIFFGTFIGYLQMSSVRVAMLENAGKDVNFKVEESEQLGWDLSRACSDEDDDGNADALVKQSLENWKTTAEDCHAVNFNGAVTVDVHVVNKWTDVMEKSLIGGHTGETVSKALLRTIEKSGLRHMGKVFNDAKDVTANFVKAWDTMFALEKELESLLGRDSRRAQREISHRVDSVCEGIVESITKYFRHISLTHSAPNKRPRRE